MVLEAKKKRHKGLDDYVEEEKEEGVWPTSPQAPTPWEADLSTLDPFLFDPEDLDEDEEDMMMIMDELLEDEDEDNMLLSEVGGCHRLARSCYLYTVEDLKRGVVMMTIAGRELLGGGGGGVDDDGKRG